MSNNKTTLGIEDVEETYRTVCSIESSNTIGRPIMMGSGGDLKPTNNLYTLSGGTRRGSTKRKRSVVGPQ